MHPPGMRCTRPGRERRKPTRGLLLRRGHMKAQQLMMHTRRRAAGPSCPPQLFVVVTFAAFFSATFSLDPSDGSGPTDPTGLNPNNRGAFGNMRLAVRRSPGSRALPPSRWARLLLRTPMTKRQDGRLCTQRLSAKNDWGRF